jgi:hypothetical protein
MIDDLETRDFTYVQAFFTPHRVEYWLVMTPSKPEAKKRAEAYAKAHFDPLPTRILLYPRNYVREARALFAEGKHD